MRLFFHPFSLLFAFLVSFALLSSIADVSSFSCGILDFVIFEISLVPKTSDSARASSRKHDARAQHGTAQHSSRSHASMSTYVTPSHLHRRINCSRTASSLGYGYGQREVPRCEAICNLASRRCLHPLRSRGCATRRNGVKGTENKSPPFDSMSRI